MLLTAEEKKARLSRAFSGLRNVPEKLHRGTQALFWEHRHACRAAQKGFHPVYNLSMRDHDDTLSMAQIYFQCSSEYEAGLVLLGDYDHWIKLAQCKWFQKHLGKWRKQKAEREAHMGRSKIIELAQQGNLAAAKYLDQNKPTYPDPIEVEDDQPDAEQATKEETKPAVNATWLEQSLQRARNNNASRSD